MKVQTPEVLAQISQRDEILLIFDALLVDFAYIHHSVHSEEFRATVTKFDITSEPSLQSHINAIVTKLFELNSQYD